MANLHRGEIEAHFDGRPMTLCLTLGALAELEAAFGEEDMLALANRFAAGRLSARDAIRVLGAGLRGAGHDLRDNDIARLQADGGAAGFVDAVARLLTATFGAAAQKDGVRATADPAAFDGSAGEGAPLPFLGRR
ncbi:MAG: gene transfer agent family protein [Hyphomicrobiaceae bacterium]